MRVQRTIEVLEALVGFDTTSRNSNLALVEWVEAYLDRFGVAHERVPDKTGSKANVWATIGPSGMPGTIGPGRRTVLVDRSVPPDRAQRPPLRPRRDRHEGLRCLLPRGGAGHGCRAAHPADPPRALIRRRGRLHRRARHDRAA